MLLMAHLLRERSQAFVCQLLAKGGVGGLELQSPIGVGAGDDLRFVSSAGNGVRFIFSALFVREGDVPGK
jgi:hypothetical protein